MYLSMSAVFYYEIYWTSSRIVIPYPIVSGNSVTVKGSINICESSKK